jgi:3-deoxy-manno-octulosonate cytidylyltransferase (CMP-KDO synthetase)
MKVLGIIPSRIGSTRLPRKPLVDLCGKTMVQRTYESCLKSKLISDVIVATDSLEILDHVKSFGGKVMMTGECSSGTMRTIEVAKQFPDYEGFLNIQGDNPILDIEHIDSLIIKMMSLNKGSDIIVTPIVRFKDYSEIDSTTSVKVVMNNKNIALYFSRSKIPHLRESSLDDFVIKYGWKHLGLYGFNKSAIEKITKFNQSPLEQCELLEQLTWVFNEMKVHCVQVENDIISVDTMEDVYKVRKALEFK